MSNINETDFRKPIVSVEVWNAITHGLGVILGIIAVFMLSNKATTVNQVIAYSIYGVSFILLFLASTLYHSFIFTKFRMLFRYFDHISIFLLIAGTYTPYLLIRLNNQKGKIFFIIIWVIAFAGIALKSLFFHRLKTLGVVIYVLMGWLSVLMIKDLWNVMHFNGILLLILGGLAYTVGVFFYRNKKLKYAHVYWHLFVLAGAILMFLSIYLYV